MRLEATRQGVMNHLAQQPIPPDVLTGIFDEPPSHWPYPCAVLGEFLTDADDILCNEGQSHEGKIHVYARCPDRSQVNRALDALWDALHRTRFGIGGTQCVQCACENTEVFEEALDAKTRSWHGVLYFRVITFDA